jgi:MFS family permease
LSVSALPLSRSAAPSVVERWYVLIVMCLMYAINIAARYVVTTVFEPIRLELHLSDGGAAFLTGVPLALFYVVFGIPIAWLADRSNRRNIVAASLIIWSGFTVFCGLSQTYWQLLLGRIGVGVGEAGATPPSTSIVSDCFPADRRPMALSILALGAQFLWRQKAAFHVIMGSGVCSLWGWGLVWWTPTFLMRTYSLNVAEAGAVTGHVHLIGGIVATAGAAWFMSRPYMVDPRRVLWTLAGIIGFATLPSFVAYWAQNLWVAKLMFWIYIPAIYFFIGPCMALVLNLAPSNMRSVFTAWSVLVGNVFNLIVAPQAVGFMSDWFARGHGADAASLRLALLVLAPTGFWATWHFWAATRTVVEDQKRAIGYVTL